MKRPHNNILATIIFTPLVMVAIGAGLWIAATAAYENLRIGWAANQIIGAVITARDMKLDPSTSPEKATYSLFARLKNMESMGVATDVASNSPRLTNPWDGALFVFVQPGQDQVVLKTKMDTKVCKRLLLFFAKDIEALGAIRVDLRSSDIAAGGAKTLYDAEKKENDMNALSIHKACGQSESIMTSLTFSLR